MIKFFRNIRKSLLMENNSSKYLKYAIGEIVLVVIGILIALQINNWNENRKDKVKVKIALQSIYKDILKDSLNISTYLPEVIQVYDRNNLLIKKAYETSTTLDTLVKIMKEEFEIYWVYNLTYNRNTFDNLKSNGTFDLLPDNIKLALSDLYTTQEETWSNINETNIQYRTHLDEFLNTYNIIGRISNENYKNSFIYNNSWQNINETHFTPRVATMLGSYAVLFNTTKIYLGKVQEKIRTVIPLLEPYVN